MPLRCPKCKSENIKIGGATKHIPPRVLLICKDCEYSNQKILVDGGL